MNCYTVQTELSEENYLKLLDYLSDVLPRTLSSNIMQTRYTSATREVTVEMSTELSEEEAAQVTDAVSSFTGEYTVPDQYLYKNPVQLALNMQSMEYTTIFTWTFSGTDMDKTFVGVSLDSATNSASKPYHVRIVDVNNVTLLYDMEYNNETMTSQLLNIPSSLLPKKQASFEIQARALQPDTKVSIGLIQHVYTA